MIIIAYKNMYFVIIQFSRARRRLNFKTNKFNAYMIKYSYTNTHYF